MTQNNKYDDPEFFARYSAMPRSTAGLEAAGEWHAFRALLPGLAGKRVLDLGCGFGWHCRYARQMGARSVVGVDLSENMLERARADTDDPAIEYRHGAIEDIDFPPAAFDVVLSSLALHYVARFDLVCGKVHDLLSDGGAFVFSVEHPIFTATPGQDWYRDATGAPLHWPVDDYLMEGKREAHWLGAHLVKYHRTVETFVGTLFDSGFRLTGLSEPKPPPEMLAERPETRQELRRPMFLLIAAARSR